MVLASESRAKQTKSRPIWVRGVGSANDSPTLESRDWVEAQYVRTAAAMAYRQAGIKDPADEIDLFEVDDSYAYKELQHLVALGIIQSPSHNSFEGRRLTKPILSAAKFSSTPTRRSSAMRGIRVRRWAVI